jgi:pimeloyl-ACP methyl ester carboxylesterase
MVVISANRCQGLCFLCAVIFAASMFAKAACAAPASTAPGATGDNPPAAAHIEAEESLRSLPNGVELALYHRSLSPPPKNSRSKVVLLLPPISIPGAAAFDVQGYSLMNDLAARGLDVWALDYRGFGHSSAAPSMSDARGKPMPALRLESSVADVKEAIDTVLASTQARDLALVGYGYGGLVAGATADRYPAKISRLVLIGAAFAFNLPKDAIAARSETINGRLPAVQEIDWENSTLKQWQEMMGGRPLADVDAIKNAEAAFYAGNYTADEAGKRKVRRPAGPLLDLAGAWTNHPAFNAGQIHVATLILRGEFDPLAQPDLAAKLTGTKIVRDVVVKNTTHWLLYEHGRDQVIAETSRFLGGN